MKHLIGIIITMTCMATSSVAVATEMPELAKRNKCVACHAIDKKVVGPSWNDVADKYRGDSSAEARLIDKVSNGGSGVWGSLPEIANSKHASQEDIEKLVKFVLSLSSAQSPSRAPAMATPSGDSGTTRWSHPNLSEYAFQRDSAICDYEARGAPAQQMNIDAQAQQYAQMSPAQRANSGMFQAGAQLARAIVAPQYFDNCMLRKGYFKVKQ